MAKFKDYANKRYALSLKTYPELHAWSVHPDTAGDFWMALFDFLDMGPTTPPTSAFEPHDGNMYPSPKFFPGAKMNFTGSIFLNRDPNGRAILEVEEASLEISVITWAELYDKVEKTADAMRSLGVQTGDRVGAVISNTAQPIILCLAALSIGAIWSSISPDFGVQGILDRLVQTKPKLVFSDTSVVYNGRKRDLMPTVQTWAKTISKGEELVHIVLTSSDPKEAALVEKGITYPEFYSKGIGRKLVFEQLPFSQPAFIFYSSGTTGAPKCILHTAGGVLLQIKKDYMLQIGLRPGDLIFQYTTTAWIMWAFVLSALGTGASIVVYSGSPLYPDVGFLPKLLAKLKVNVFGTSAKYLTDLMDSNKIPRADHDLSALRKVTSTGSVLPPDVAEWFYAKGFPPNVQLISASGGTDCSCAFVGGTPLLPLHADEIMCKVLGMAVDVYDPNNPSGLSIAHSNEPGELVVTQPFPSQPLSFWGPGGDAKYKDSYFSMFGPKVWVQGDLVRISTTTGGIMMLGRSDGVLNPSGVRFGSAEIYSVVRLFPSIVDSVCVGQRRPHDRDESVLLFLKLAPGAKRTQSLKDQLKAEIGKQLSRRHVPRYVFYVDDIPYSHVGKKLEILVKNIVCGRADGKSSVVANPECLRDYARFFDVEEAERAGDVDVTAKL
ncbi:acetoacetyl-synthase [Lepidopterella palustris CBS 459.81]|uniref:Acetoacetyl-synthase n=1 Tax=Lepidopterella palustris CBS 459.81 TaxID=1314670 RepID=A0A8E2JAI4_9PEZI|nr:acetoacetyl-synthase [Lepidopterella palustris CBS 459.81]